MFTYIHHAVTICKQNKIDHFRAVVMGRAEEALAPLFDQKGPKNKHILLEIIYYTQICGKKSRILDFAPSWKRSVFLTSPLPFREAGYGPALLKCFQMSCSILRTMLLLMNLQNSTETKWIDVSTLMCANVAHIPNGPKQVIVIHFWPDLLCFTFFLLSKPISPGKLHIC